MKIYKSFEEWWEEYKDENPPIGQAKLYYTDNREYAEIGWNAAIVSKQAEIDELKTLLVKRIKEYGVGDFEAIYLRRVMEEG